MTGSSARLLAANRRPKKTYGAMAKTDPHWDYVMVFPNPPKTDVDIEDLRDSIIMKLRTAGLETKSFLSAGKELVFTKIRAPEELLRDIAALMKVHLQLEPRELRKAAYVGMPEHDIAPFPIKDVKKQFKLSPYDFIYAAYMQSEDVQKFFRKKGRDGSIFDATERIWIIERIITDHALGAGCDLDRLIYEGIIIDCYPLHNEEAKLELRTKWLLWGTAPMSQPFDEIRDYFGVKVALYFLYLGHCTQWYLYPAVIGLIPGIMDFALNSADHADVFAWLSPSFGAFMVIWMTLYLEDWVRLNAHKCMDWGTSNFTQIVQLRPQFKGETIPSPINGHPTRYFSPREKIKRVAFSWFIISLLILVVFALVAAIFYLRWDFTKGYDASALTVHNIKIGSMIAAFANVVQITVMTKIYNIVSIYLNDQENHRTDVEYENSFIIKTVIFQFVNNYAALFYVAFLKSGIEGCDVSCMFELQYCTAIVYCSRLFTGNFTEVALPRFWGYVNKFRLLGSFREAQDPEVEARKSNAERELFMAQYDWRGTFDDYTEQVIQFGFTTMFVVAFPFAPLLSYLNNYFEIRLDAYRLLNESRRPRPQNVNGMGYWYNVLQAFAAISICTNGGVVIFTGTYFNGVSTAMRVWYFTLFISFMFLFKYLLMAVIDDTPAGVAAQKLRQEFLVSKCLYHLPDDDTSRLQNLCADLENPDEALTIHEADEF